MFVLIFDIESVRIEICVCLGSVMPCLLEVWLSHVFHSEQVICRRGRNSLSSFSSPLPPKTRLEISLSWGYHQVFLALLTTAKKVEIAKVFTTNITLRGENWKKCKHLIISPLPLFPTALFKGYSLPSWVTQCTYPHSFHITNVGPFWLLLMWTCA